MEGGKNVSDGKRGLHLLSTEIVKFAYCDSVCLFVSVSDYGEIPFDVQKRVTDRNVGTREARSDQTSP